MGSSSTFRFLVGTAGDIAKAVVEIATSLTDSPYQVVAEDRETGWYLLKYVDPEGKSVNNAYFFIGPGIWRPPPAWSAGSDKPFLVYSYGIFVIGVREAAVDPSNWKFSEPPQLFAFNPIYTDARLDLRRCGEDVSKFLGDEYDRLNSHGARAYIFVDKNQITVATEPNGEPGNPGLPWLTHLLRMQNYLNPSLQRPVPMPHWAQLSDGGTLYMIPSNEIISHYFDSVDFNEMQEVVRISVTYHGDEIFVYSQSEAFVPNNGNSRYLCIDDTSDPIYGTHNNISKSIREIVLSNRSVGPIHMRWGKYTEFFNSMIVYVISIYGLFSSLFEHKRYIARYVMYGALTGYAVRSVDDGNVYVAFPVVTDSYVEGPNFGAAPSMFLGMLDIAPIVPINSHITHGDVVQMQDGRQYIAVELRANSNVMNLPFAETWLVRWRGVSGHPGKIFVRTYKHNPFWLIRYA